MVPPYLSRRSLEMARQRVERGRLDDDFARLDLVVERYRVAAAFEADGGEVDGHIALLADDFAVLLVVAGIAAVVARVEADAVRATVLLDDDESHDGAVLRLVFEAMQVAVGNLAEFDGGHAVGERVVFRRRQRDDFLRLRDAVRQPR